MLRKLDRPSQQQRELTRTHEELAEQIDLDAALTASRRNHWIIGHWLPPESDHTGSTESSEC